MNNLQLWYVTSNNSTKLQYREYVNKGIPVYCNLDEESFITLLGNKDFETVGTFVKNLVES